MEIIHFFTFNYFEVLKPLVFLLFEKKFIFILGDPPTKAIEFHGYMVFKSILNGDRIPICSVNDLEVALVNLDLPVRVRVPIGDHTWHSLPEVRAAEVQCMQLSLSLLSRHESEIYVRIETEKDTSNYLRSNSNHEQKRLVNSRRTSDPIKKHIEEAAKNVDNQLSISKHQNNPQSSQMRPTRNSADDARKILRQQSSKLTKTSTLSHPVSDKLYRNDEKRVVQERLKTEKQHLVQGEKSSRTQQTIVREKSRVPSSFSSKTSKTKTNTS